MIRVRSVLKRTLARTRTASTRSASIVVKARSYSAFRTSMAISLDSERGRGLRCPLHLCSRSGLTCGEHCDAGGTWNRLLDQLEALTCHRWLRGHDHSSDVAAWARETRDKSEIDGVAVCQHHDDRNCLRRVLRRTDRIGAHSDKDVDSAPDKFLRQPGKLVELALSESLLHNEVLAFHVTEVSQRQGQNTGHRRGR